MDATIQFDYPDATYTNGDTIYGAIVVYCTSTVTLSNITVNLVGESKSMLTGTSSLLLHRQNREKHRVGPLWPRLLTVTKVFKVVHDKQDILPYSHSFDDSKHEPAKLGFGYHSFPFGLQVSLMPH
jgi:hypothetical protein